MFSADVFFQGLVFPNLANTLSHLLPSVVKVCLSELAYIDHFSVLCAMLCAQKAEKCGLGEFSWSAEDRSPLSRFGPDLSDANNPDLFPRERRQYVVGGASIGNQDIHIFDRADQR
jgi:hypothetical protein